MISEETKLNKKSKLDIVSGCTIVAASSFGEQELFEISTWKENRIKEIKSFSFTVLSLLKLLFGDSFMSLLF